MKEKGLRINWSELKRKTGDRWIYLLVFFLPAALMYTAYAFFKVHPFGDNSALVLDLNGQYVYYYEAFRDALRGEGSLIYNWSRNLSGEMFGVFAYYLASPFMPVICILPRNCMCGAIELMQILKIGTAAVTFAFFLRKCGKPSKTSVIIFSVSYSLMAYMVVQLMDPMWLDGLIYLPLICLGVHRLIDEGRLCPYIIPLALMFIAHFYIGYMVGFFTLCYFIYYYFSVKREITLKNMVTTALRFASATIVAVAAACIVIIPVYNSLKLGKLEFSQPDWSLATQFDFLTFITKLFPMSYDTVYPEGLPMIFCGTGALILVPLFFMNERIPVREKIGKGALLAVLTVCMYIRPIDIVWHGMQVPNWLPYRYSFAFSFIFLLAAYRAFENADGVTAKEVGGVFFGLMIFLFWCERENYEHFQIFEARTDDGGELYGVIQGIWIAMLALCVYFALICLWRKHSGKKALAAVMCAAVCVDMTLNAMDTLHKIDVDVAYSKYSSYEPYMSDLRAAVDMIQEYDSYPFYRMEATFHRMVNDPIGTGYYGISHSSSTMNAPALKMLQQMGYAYGGNYTKYDGATMLTDALFDIRYLMDKEDFDDVNDYMDQRANIPQQYTLVTHIDEQGSRFKFYRNPYALGLGIVSSSAINGVQLSETDPFENQNNVFGALISQTEEVRCFNRILPHTTDSENLATSDLGDGHTRYYYLDEGIPECHMDYVVRMDRSGALYMYLPTKYERSCNIWIQPEEEYQRGEQVMDYAGQFFVGDNYSILKLGEFERDEDIRIRVTIANDDNEAFWSDALFYTFDIDEFERSDELLKERVWDITKFEDTYLEGNCYAEEEGQYLFTTIPVENGWTVTVNGREVQYETALDSLISIPLDKGENTVAMKYSPDYFRMSVIISILGWGVVVIIFLFEYKDGRIVRRLLTGAKMTADGGAEDKETPKKSQAEEKADEQTGKNDTSPPEK